MIFVRREKSLLTSLNSLVHAISGKLFQIWQQLPTPGNDVSQTLIYVFTSSKFKNTLPVLSFASEQYIIIFSRPPKSSLHHV